MNRLHQEQAHKAAVVQFVANATVQFMAARLRGNIEMIAFDKDKFAAECHDLAIAAGKEIGILERK